MTRAPDETADLELVASYFAKHGLKAERFSKEEQRVGKTPDSRVKRGDTLHAYCEVKSPRDEWLDDQLDAAPPGTIVGGVRDDPTFNRLSGLIHKAVSQFDAVNADRRVPNILVFVNHDQASSPNDLVETLTGQFHADDGKRYVTMAHVSEGRIREEKRRVDLYLWLDGKTGKVQLALFSEADDAHKQALCSMLGFDPSKIEH